jgi:hypothetical protein
MYFDGIIYLVFWTMAKMGKIIIYYIVYFVKYAKFNGVIIFRNSESKIYKYFENSDNFIYSKFIYASDINFDYFKLLFL